MARQVPTNRAGANVVPISINIRKPLPAILHVSDEHVSERRFTLEAHEEYTNISGDRRPIHVEGARPIIHGTHLLMVVTSIIKNKFPGPETMVVSIRDMQFLSAVHVGDKVRIRLVIREIVSDYEVYLQADIAVYSDGRFQPVCSGTFNLLIPGGIRG